MAVITQNYDIDLKATGERPVVKMSQFDTGSRTIVFTVYDGHDLAQIDGMVARVDGTRADDVGFSRTCTVGTGGKVSFTISQEMTKVAGKHTAELVIIDEDGNPIGTQNFIIEVEAASMRRDSAASADDRTLYDQYTDSVSKTVADKIARMDSKYGDFKKSMSSKADAMNKTAEDISGLVGASSKPITIYDENVPLNGSNIIRVRLTYDPVTALVHAYVRGTLRIDTGSPMEYDLCQVDAKYCPGKEFFDYTVGEDKGYIISTDNLKEVITSDTSKQSNYQMYYIRRKGIGEYTLRFYLGYGLPDHEGSYELSLNAFWYARGGKYIGVTSIGTGGNTLKIGKTTTGAPDTQASVVNSGTAKDVVLDFTIPKGNKGDTGAKGDKGDKGARGNRIYTSSYESAPNSNSHWWSDLKPKPSVANPPIIGDDVITPAGNLMSITDVTTDSSAGGGGTYGVGDILINLKGQKGDKGDAGACDYTLPAATSTTRGGVIVGDGLLVTTTGKVNVRSYGFFNNKHPKIPVGLSSGSGNMCIGIDPESFTQKDLEGNNSNISLGLKPATASTVGGVKIGAGINVTADGTIDVQALVDRISQMQSKYDALISTATYDIDSGIDKGTWYDDYTWRFCRLRVVGGVCTLSFSATRKASVWNAKAWDRAHVLTLPDGLGSLGELNTPIVTNANAEPNNNTALQIDGNKVAFRPTVNATYNTGTWFQGTVSWVAAGSQSDDVSQMPDDHTSVK